MAAQKGYTVFQKGEGVQVAGKGVVLFDQVSAPGTTTDKLYNVSGNLTWNGTNISSGAATAYDDIGDPDANSTIAFAGYTNTWTSTLNGGGIHTFTNTTADLTSDTSFIDLKYTDDGDANGLFVRFYDNVSDLKFSVGLNGLTTIAGSATGTAALVLTAGDVTLTSGDLDVAADNRRVSFGASGDTDSYILFNGTSLVFYDATLGVEATLSQLANNSPTGDFNIANGQFTWTDSSDEAAGTWTFSNTTGTDIAVSSSVTTGKCHSIVANGLTSGTMMYLESSVAGLTSGKYFKCYDGAADDFSIGVYGTTTIAGNASTDILIIDAGDIQLTSGDIDVDLGFVTVDNTADEGNYFKRNNATGTAPVLEVEQTHATGGVAFLVDQDATGDVNAQEITNAGTGFSVSATGGAAGSEGFEFISAASATGNGLLLDGTTGTAAWIGAANTGFAQIQSDGTLAQTTATLLLLAFSGTSASGGAGTCLRVVDTSTSGGGTEYAAYISSTNSEGLHVDAGISQFDEKITLGVDDTGADFKAFGATTARYMEWDESADTLFLTNSTILRIGGTESADGVTFDFDGTNLDIDAVTANDNINFGSDVDTNVIFTTAGGAALTIDHGANTLTVSATAFVTVTGNSTGQGLRIPTHATNSPSTQDGAGNIYFEQDAKKLWVYDGTGWVGVVLA